MLPKGGRCAVMYHNAVGLAHGPQVDPAVLSAGGQQAAGALPQGQTGDCAGVSLELLCGPTRQDGHGSTNDSGHPPICSRHLV